MPDKRIIAVIAWSTKNRCALELHYVNRPMQDTADFRGVKNNNLMTNKMRFFSSVDSKRKVWVHVRKASMRWF